MVGSKGWILLTSDKRIRYNLLEKHALEIYAVREFVFTSGNMSGQDMAKALEVALKKMRSFCRRTKPPFVASITRTARFISAGQRAESGVRFLLVALALSEQVLKVVREMHENFRDARLHVLDQIPKRRHTSTHKSQERQHDPKISGRSRTSH